MQKSIPEKWPEIAPEKKELLDILAEIIANNFLKEYEDAHAGNDNLRCLRTL